MSYTFSILKIEFIHFVLSIQQAIGRAALDEDLQRGDEYIELFIEYYYNIEYYYIIIIILLLLYNYL